MKLEGFPKLNITPMEHQKKVAAFAVDRFRDGLGTFNIGEIGTGKTLVALMWALANSYNTEDKILWITPSFLKADVEEKIGEYFEGGVPTIITYGKQDELPKELRKKGGKFPFGYKACYGANLDEGKYKIVVASYELMNLKYAVEGRVSKIEYREAVAKFFDYKFIVIDESHRIKDWTTKNYSSVGYLISHARKYKETECCVMPMTGTPVGNGLHDLYAPMSLLNIPSFPTEKEFKELWCVKDDYGTVTHVRKRREREWLDLVSKHSIIVRKKEVLKDLLDKVIDHKYFRLSPKIQQAYEEYAESQMLSIMGHTVVDRNKLTLLLHLQAFVSGFMVKKTPLEDGGSESEFIFVHDEKVKFCMSLIENYLSQDENVKIIVWSRFKATEELLAQHLEKKKIKTMRLISSKKGEMIKDFRTNDDRVVIINLGCNEGFTVVEASKTIYLEESYSFLQKEQSGGRNHRIGQKDEVEETTIIAVGTIDEVIRDAIERKNDDSEKFLTYGDETENINKCYQKLLKI